MGDGLASRPGLLITPTRSVPARSSWRPTTRSTGRHLRLAEAIEFAKSQKVTVSARTLAWSTR